MQETNNTNEILRKSNYYYDLPEELIAQTPAEKRDMSRLLVLDRKTGEIAHRHFCDICDYLRPGDALVLNNSKVIPARIFGKRYIKNTDGSESDTLSESDVEVLLLKRLSDNEWEAIVRPGKKLHEGTRVHFSDKLEAVIKGVKDGGIKMRNYYNYQINFLSHTKLSKVAVLSISVCYCLMYGPPHNL